MKHQGRGNGVKHRLRPLHGHQRFRGNAGQTHLTVKDQGRDERRVIWHEEVDGDGGHYVYSVKYVAERSARKPYTRRSRSTRCSTSSNVLDQVQRVGQRWPVIIQRGGGHSQGAGCRSDLVNSQGDGCAEQPTPEGCRGRLRGGLVRLQ